MLIYLKSVVVAALLAPILLPFASAHTIDAVGEYRLEIGWMNEPVVSGETNGIEIFVSPLDPCPEAENTIKCAESQKFENGIGGLEKDIKIQLVYKAEKITLPFVADHNIDGKYYAFVNPTVSGFYQANLLGDIHGTSLSLSMHPPKVNERAYIEFPEPANLAVEQIMGEHTTLSDEIISIKDDLKRMEASQTGGMEYVGIGLGIAGIAIASAAMIRSRK